MKKIGIRHFLIGIYTVCILGYATFSLYQYISYKKSIPSPDLATELVLKSIHKNSFLCSNEAGTDILIPSPSFSINDFNVLPDSTIEAIILSDENSCKMLIDAETNLSVTGIFLSGDINNSLIQQLNSVYPNTYIKKVKRNDTAVVGDYIITFEGQHGSCPLIRHGFHSFLFAFGQCNEVLNGISADVGLLDMTSLNVNKMDIMYGIFMDGIPSDKKLLSNTCVYYATLPRYDVTILSIERDLMFDVTFKGSGKVVE